MTSKTSYNLISALKDINKTDIKDINKTQGRGRTKRRKRKTKQRTSFRFPNKKQAGKRLNVNFKFIIPSTKGESREISKKSFQKRINHVLQFVAKLFQGSTLEKAIGTYQYKNQLIQEDVSIISVFTTHHMYYKQMKKLHKFILDKKKQWGQDAMGFEYQGSLYLV